MQTRIIPCLVILAVALALPCSSEAQATLFGTWNLNLAKSTYNPGPAPYKSGTCRIEPSEKGFRVTYNLIGLRGGVTHIEWYGRLDGKDYALEGVDEVLTNAYTKVDDQNYQVVLKVDGQVAATARITVSLDLKTITTITTTGQNVSSVTVYDKR
jgi:hypothetical protein